MMGSARGEVRRDYESADLPRSSAALLQFYSDKTATSVTFHAVVAHAVHVVWLNVTKKRRR